MREAIRFFWADAVGRRILLTLVVAPIIIGAYGFIIDVRAFLNNLLASLVANAVSILVVLFIIDWFMEYRRKRAWGDVHRLTLSAIAGHLGEIALGVYRHFPGIIWDKTVEQFATVHAYPLNRETVAAFSGFVESLRKAPTPHGKDLSASDMVVKYYHDLEWDFSQIQDVLTPRMVQTPSDRRVVDSLIQFDQAHRRLRHAIIGHKQAVTQSAYRPLLDPRAGASRG